MPEDKNTGTLTCPKCGHKQTMGIPVDSCIPFYKCGGCSEIIEADSCCVFCDYADKPCPVGKSTD